MLPTVSPKWRKAGCNGHQMANAQDISSFLPPLPDTVICLQNIHSFSSLLNKIKTPMGGGGGGKYKCHFLVLKNADLKHGVRGKLYEHIFMMEQSFGPSKLASFIGIYWRRFFTSPVTWDPFPGKCRGWRWDLLHVKHRLYLWATSLPQLWHAEAAWLTCISSVEMVTLDSHGKGGGADSDCLVSSTPDIY